MQNYFMSLSGIKIPKIIYGTAWKEERTSQLVELALVKGFRGVDTACQPKHYQEGQVGDGIAKALQRGVKREELFIQTKFTKLQGQDPQRIPYNPKSPLAEQIRQSISVSLKNLKTDYLDSVVLHSPLDTWNDNLLAWTTLEEFVTKGIIRQLGISNCYELSLLERLYSEAKFKPSLLQNRFYADSHYDVALRKFCKQKGIYYQCFWTLNANKHIWQRREVNKLGEKYNKTNAQIFFRCLIQNDIYPLYGTCSEEHMQHDLDLFNFCLTEDECQSITKLGPF